MAEHNLIGTIGEDIAARLVRKQGLRIRERNWKMGHLEVDIIAENQYAVKDALCLFSDVPELLEKALRIYQGRAFWDGTGDLEEDFLRNMADKYGLILL